MNVLKSRKFWAAVAALILSLVTEYIPDFPLDPSQLEAILAVIAAYILGTALEDGSESEGLTVGAPSEHRRSSLLLRPPPSRTSTAGG